MDRNRFGSAENNPLIVPQHRRTFLIALHKLLFFKAVFYNSEGVKVLFQELCDPLDI